MSKRCILFLVLSVVPAISLAGSEMHFRAMHGYGGEICSVRVDQGGAVRSKFANQFRRTKENDAHSADAALARRIVATARALTQFNQACSGGDGRNIDLYLTVTSGDHVEKELYCKGASDWPGSSDAAQLVDLLKQVLPESYRQACFSY